MSTITIMAALADLPSGLLAIPGVDDGKGRKVTVQAVVVGDVAQWTIPDTDNNRELFQREYKPSGIFRAQVGNIRAVPPIDGEGSELDSMKAALEERDAEAQALSAKLEEREAEMLSLNTQLSEALAELSKLKDAKAKK